jgi:hypothetical protein
MSPRQSDIVLSKISTECSKDQRNNNKSHLLPDGDDAHILYKNIVLGWGFHRKTDIPLKNEMSQYVRELRVASES